jgi:hypothetical protein
MAMSVSATQGGGFFYMFHIIAQLSANLPTSLLTSLRDLAGLSRVQRE